MNNIIKFYGRTKGDPKYWPFSNFYHAPFTDLAGTIWPTTEHYFQAMKFLPSVMVLRTEEEGDIPLRQYIRELPTPKQAAETGRRRDFPLREDWDMPFDVKRGFLTKDYYMYRAIRYKFFQHKDLRELLVNTGNAKIIEDSPIDYYWGCGKDGSGKNMLGKLLMKLREELTCPTPEYNCEDCQDCTNECETIPRVKIK